MTSIFRSYLQLTKPTIILLVVITGFSTMAAEGSLFQNPLFMTVVLLAIALSAASANAFNQFIDRDIDAVMERTKRRRPLPLQTVRPLHAFIFALIVGAITNLYLYIYVNPVAAWISVATILFYVFIYTLWLKRRHYYNIVIGGAAGATAPLIASAAVNGRPSLLSWILFLIIFTWTPPHFWALALALKEEYQRVKIPMLPNVLGEKRTRTEIIIYTFLLLPLSIIPFFWNEAGMTYLGSAFMLWVWYWRETVMLLKSQKYKKLFWISIFYLFGLFIVLALDGAIRFWFWPEVRMIG